VTHTKSGREFVYHAKQSRVTEARSLLRGLLANFFDGSLKNAIASHFNDPASRMNEKELDELSKMVEELKKSDRKPKRQS
jgi:predicted transcriptional regulator